jgi:hypothetical protein
MYGRMKNSSGNASSVHGVNSKERNMVPVVQNKKELACSGVK